MLRSPSTDVSEEYIAFILRVIKEESRSQATKKLKTKLHGLSPRANYTDQATAACRRSDCQLLRIEGAT
jgi:hypothetical protein